MATFNEDNLDNNAYDVYKPKQWLLVGVYVVFVTAVSVLANSIVLTVMAARHVCLHKRFRATHLFMCSLAFSDICFSISIHPMLAATCFGVDVDKIFSKAGCDWFGFGAIFFGCVSMLIHGSCSFSRYKTIVHPQELHWQEFPCNLLLLLANILVAFSFALAPVLGWGRYETFEFGCTVAFHDASIAVRSYVIALLISVLALPLAICIYCYVRITIFAYDSKLRLLKIREEEQQEQLDALCTEDSKKIALEKTLRAPKATFRTNTRTSLMTSLSLVDRRLTRLTFLTAASYVIMWTPFAVLSIWETFYPPKLIPSGFRVISSLFCKSATAVNPFIYFFMSAGFREDLLFLTRRFLVRMRLSKLPSVTHGVVSPLAPLTAVPTHVSGESSDDRLSTSVSCRSVPVLVLNKDHEHTLRMCRSDELFGKKHFSQDFKPC